MRKFLLLFIFLTLILSGCSSLDTIGENQTLSNNEGICVLTFKILRTSRVKLLSFDIIGNNETREIDIEYDDENKFYFVLKQGDYKIENFKASTISGGGYTARDSTEYISRKRFYFTVKAGKINHLGDIVIKETISKNNANMIFRGRNSQVFLIFDISFNQRNWDIFNKKYPKITKKYKVRRHFLRFRKPVAIVERVNYKREAGILRGKSGIYYKMKARRVKFLLKQENRNFDVINIIEIVETARENTIIKYVFSDNENKPRWKGRLYKIIEITKMSPRIILKRLNKKYKKYTNNWQNSFEIVTLKRDGNQSIITYISKNFLKR